MTDQTLTPRLHDQNRDVIHHLVEVCFLRDLRLHADGHADGKEQ